MYSPFIRKISLCTVLLSSIFMIGCSTPAPNYSPSISNVELIKAANANNLSVGKVQTMSGSQGADAIGLRGSQMISPVGKDYGDYLAYALRQELQLANAYDPQSGIEISGTLMTNNINAGGMNTNDAQIQARFVVKKQGVTVYEQTKKAEMQWESSFAGAVAIPLAMNNYPVLVQKLLSNLFSDPSFVAAIKK